MAKKKTEEEIRQQMKNLLGCVGGPLLAHLDATPATVRACREARRELVDYINERISMVLDDVSADSHKYHVKNKDL